MARYLDINGTTAGFSNAGVPLTANANGIVWNTNPAGSPTAPTTYLFTGSTEEMNFGSTSVPSTTAGTLTLNVNASVYAIRTKNLTGAQTVSGSSTLTLSRADGVPVLDLDQELILSCPLAGTQGFDAFGSTINLKNTSNPISGTLTGPVIVLSPASGDGNIIPNASVVTSNLFLSLPPAGTYSFGRPVSNVANYGRWQVNPSVFPVVGTITSDLSGMTGTGVDNDEVLSVGPRAGFAVFSYLTGLHTVNFSGVLPSQVSYYFNFPSSTESYGIVFNYTGTTTNYPNTCLAFVPNTATQNRFEFNANQTSGGLTLGGGIQKYGPSGLTLTMKLGGTSAFDNTISGPISQTQTALAIEKIGTTRWIFTNANTYSGGTTISGGTLRGSNNNNAFGTGNITLSGGTLELDTISPTNTGLNAVGTIRSVGGLSPSMASQITLAGSTTFEAIAGTALTLNSLSAITGAQPITLSAIGTGAVTVASQITQATSLTKSGAGTATLSNTANTINGTVAANGGTLEIAAVGSLGGTGGLTLAGSTIVRHTGSTGGTLSRTVSGSSVTGGFENDGNGALVVSTGTITGTSNNIKLGGTGTGQFNTFGVTLAAGANAFTKEGAGRWISTNGNDLTGTTNVSGTGTLMAAPSAATNNRLLGGNVTVGSGSGIQLSSDNGQLGKNTYNNLTFQGTSGNRSRIRIGGSAVNPTVQMSGNLVLPAVGQTTFDLSADVFKTPNTYTLIEFTGSFGVTGGTAGSNIAASGLTTGLQAAFSYVTGTPNKLNVTISKV